MCYTLHANGTNAPHNLYTYRRHVIFIIVRKKVKITVAHNPLNRRLNVTVVHIIIIIISTATASLAIVELITSRPRV